MLVKYNGLDEKIKGLKKEIVNLSGIIEEFEKMCESKQYPSSVKQKLRIKTEKLQSKLLGRILSLKRAEEKLKRECLS